MDLKSSIFTSGLLYPVGLTCAQYLFPTIKLMCRYFVVNFFKVGVSFKVIFKVRIIFFGQGKPKRVSIPYS